MAVFIVDLSAKAIVRRHRSLHVYADTEAAAIKKNQIVFQKIASKQEQSVGRGDQCRFGC